MLHPILIARREIISHAGWLYFRFSLSFRDVEEILAQSGIVVTYETDLHSSSLLTHGAVVIPGAVDARLVGLLTCQLPPTNEQIPGDASL